MKNRKKTYFAKRFVSRVKLIMLIPLLFLGITGAFLAFEDNAVSKSNGTVLMGAASLVAFGMNGRKLSPEGGGGGTIIGEDILLEKVKKEVAGTMSSVMEKAMQDNKDLSEIREFYKTFKESKTLEDVTALKSKLDELGLEITALKEVERAPKQEGYKTIREALTAAFHAKKAEMDQAVYEKQKAPIQISVKAAVTMSVESTIGSGATQVSITENTGIISPIRKRELRYLANVSVGQIGGNRAMWIEEEDEQGNPIFIGEGDPKTQVSVQYVEKTANVKKIAVYGKVTTELMADIPQLISYIETNLMRRMDIKVEDQLLYGNNIGDNLNGVDNFATAFVAPSTLALSIPNANEYDVLEAVATQVELAFGQANVAFVHPATLSKMKLLKDADGQYIYPRWASADGLVVSGMRVISTSAVTQGEFLAGDFTAVQVRMRDELGITIGLDGNDFTNNKKTILCEKRLVQFCSANDTPCIVKGTFADAITDLNLPT